MSHRDPFCPLPAPRRVRVARLATSAARPAVRGLLAFAFGALWLSACSSRPATVVEAPRLDAQPEVVHAPRVAEFDAGHYSLDLAIAPETRMLEGLCTVRLHALRDGLERVELDFEGLLVGSVTDGRGRNLLFEHTDGTLSIALAEPLRKAQFVELAVDYRGTPVKGMWFAREIGGVPTQVFTHGQCEDSRWWFPCIDDPSDRATSEIRVRIPEDWVAVAAGERIDQIEHGDGTRTEHWRMTAPHPPYLLTLAAGDFTVLEDAWDDVPLSYLVEGSLADRVPEALGDTPAALEFVSELTGVRYPYAKYSQVCVDRFPFGGMENISATTLTDRCLQDARGLADSPATDLVVHEAAHQWFGDLLTCRDWSQVWLNEGFATYVTLLFRARHDGLDEFRGRLRDAQEDYLEGDVGDRRRPIVWNRYRDPLDLFPGGHTYAGGATRLHLLRHVVGEEAFFLGLRRYVAENANSSVTTADLRASMEQASGKDLGRFFDQWLRSPGYPEFVTHWQWDERRALLLFSVHQSQAVDDGTPAAFAVPVDIEVRTSAGRKIERVEVQKRRELFSIDCAERPLWVRFDKFGAIPKRHETEKSAEEWILIAREDDDVGGRRDAVAALARIAANDAEEEVVLRSLSLIGRLLLEDESRFVRREAARALGRLRVAGLQLGPAAIDALKQGAGWDDDPSVRVAAFEALAGFGRNADLEAFGKTEFERAPTWTTMAAAAGLVCAADSFGAQGWLVERLDRPSPHDVLESLMVGHLVRLQSQGAVAELAKRARDSASDELTQTAAVQALGRVKIRREEAARALVDQLDSSSARVRRAAVEALGRLEQSAALPFLSELYESSVFPRERRAIEAVFDMDWVRALGAEGSAAGAGL